MVKSFISLFILLLSYTTGVNAQAISKFLAIRDSVVKNTDKFLTVKGVELKPGIRMEDALKIFLDKGWEKHEYFDYIKSKNGWYLLTGSFFNTRNCEICILPTTNNKNIVASIKISFPKKDSFKNLKNEYDELKYSLSQKYHITSCNESFDSELIENSNDDEMKLRALSKDQATFDTMFVVSDDNYSETLGIIELHIMSIPISDGTEYFVQLVYHTSDDMIDYMTKGDDL